MADTEATATPEAALAQAHQAISEGAEASKRAVAAHKRVLRRQLQALEQLEAECERLGIRLVLDDTDH
jgi:hypothetical protein